MKIKFQLNVSIGRKSEPVCYDEKKNGNVSFSECVKREIITARKRNSFSTADNYATALRSFLHFACRPDIDISEISSEMLVDYQKWLLGRNVGLNTISCYMRSLRSVYSRAGYGDAAVFRNVFTGRTTTDKRSVPLVDIRKLLAIKLRKGSRLELTRDIFLFSFYCQGMPFVDVAYLLKSQITDKHIRYHRKKTGQSVNIAIEPSIERIIRHYDGCSLKYVFPILTSGDNIQKHKQYIRQLGYYNRNLKILAHKAGISRPLTSYVARHSWASIAFQNNVDLQVISRAMGHSNPITTMIYIKELDNEIIELANRKIIDACKPDIPF